MLGMGEGMIFDQMETDHLRAQSKLANALVNWQKAYNELLPRHETIMSDLAYVFAMRSAFESFVSKTLGPNHPLVQDKGLRERIGNAGVTAFLATNDWEAAKEAGRTFALPSMPDPHESCVPAEAAAQLQVNAEKRVEALNYEVAKLTKACAQHMAQSAAFRAQLTVADPENPLVTDGALRQRVADVAYDQFAATGYKDWNGIREVGATFVSTTERSRSARSSPSGG